MENEIYIGNKKEGLKPTAYDNCIMCNESVAIYLPIDMITAITERDDNIQTFLHKNSIKLDADTREFFVSGICPKCSKKIFG